MSSSIEWLAANMPDLGSYIPLGVSLELQAKFDKACEMEKENEFSSNDMLEMMAQTAKYMLNVNDNRSASCVFNQVLKDIRKQKQIQSH